MLARIATTYQPATDLGFLLHKHPDRMQTVDLSFGTARVFYPVATPTRCEAALTVSLPPVTVAGPGEAYVSALPYDGGCYLPTALRRAFGTALNGRCEARPELVQQAIPLEIVVTPIACGDGAPTPQMLFVPLGWECEDELLPLDAAYPEWGAVHRTIRLRGSHRLADALRQLCVLLPAMSGQRPHYMDVGDVDRLGKLGADWLDRHPERGRIIRRYLHFRHLIDRHDPVPRPAADAPATLGEPGAAEAVPRRRLHNARIETAVRHLVAGGARRIVDLGCGHGDLVVALLAEPSCEHIIGVDPSPQALLRAERQVRQLVSVPNRRDRVTLLQGAATYPDHRLLACDSAALLEVVEHLEPGALNLLESTVFGYLRPRLLVMTTPNREHNVLFSSLTTTGLRARDHRFEWTRDEYRAWAERIAAQYGYDFTCFAVGDAHPTLGAPTQGGVFCREQ